MKKIILGPLYADGINAPRISVTGRDLPLSRVVSRTMHPDEGYHDHAGTVMVCYDCLFETYDFVKSIRIKIKDMEDLKILSFLTNT